MNTSKPERLQTGKWNCSSDNWKGLHGLQPHLVCNFLVQCEDERDEEDCGYTRCHQENFGHLLLGITLDGFEVEGTCYILGFAEDTPHHATNELCKTKGGRLVSWKPRDNIEKITRVLWSYYPFDFKIGLTSPTIELPWM
ncbi:hypothetical protein ACOMHN_041865 [Nucella lapillus]